MDSSFLLRICLAAVGFFMLLATMLDIVYRRFGFRQSDETVASSLPPSPPLCTRNWTYQVFPSFRGEDVRKDFLSHIKKEFQRKGITPFIDNEIRRGESIGPELVQAIRGSNIALVLLSRNYASSSWCLNELVEIIKCREELGQTVMTIFYKVDPSDVKKLMGDFGKVFRRTCKGKTKEDTERWRQALEKVATIAGYHSNDWDSKADMVEKIVTDVPNMLNNSTQSSDFHDFVGMEAHMEKMGQLLRLDLEDEVRMVGIWGPSGIGKSSIARSLFIKHSHQFPLSAYMENIKIRYPRPCYDEYSAKLQLQEEFLSRITNHKDTKIHHLGVAQDRLKDKRVLVVLDDVDQSVQLQAMAKETQWFGRGSRIIITSEDLKLLKAHGINHIYKVDFPLTDHALEIFCIHAFGQKYPFDGFKRLAWEVTDIVGNLPLGLKVMGSYFRGMSKQEWTEALPGLRTHLDAGIQSILKFSYNALDEKDKKMFLHIACFFDGERLDQTLETLAMSFSDVSQGIHVLVEKSLISINFWGRIEMPKLLAQLGREIVRKQSIHDPGLRQFLFDANEICEVLTDGTGSRSVIGINLNLCDIVQELKISERGFERMSNLQFLRLWDCPFHKVLCSPGSLNHLTRKLRILEWFCFPLTAFPSEFHTEFLVKIYMHYSKLEKLWEGIQPLRNLKLMSLESSANLKELPNLSSATNLQTLILIECSSLLELPYSIGEATSLHYLNLFGCSSLIQLPASIGNATSLQEFSLYKCSSLVKLPSSFGNLINLKKCNLNGCSSLVDLPSSFGNLINLKKFSLSRCTSLLELPSSIGNAINLKILNLSRCTSLLELPSSIGNAINLKKLDLSGCTSLVELPFSIGNAINLKKLDLSGCTSLVELPFSIGNAINLKILDLSRCKSLLELPYSIDNVINLKLDLSECTSLWRQPPLLEIPLI